MIQYLPILWAIISSTWHVSYIKSIYTWSTKPNKITWFFWALAPLIACIASVVNGARWSALPVFMIGFWPLVIFIIACFYKKSYRKLSLFDYMCGAFSLLALLLWRHTQNANFAIIFAIVSDTFAAIPTIKKVWHHPGTESKIIYATAFLAMSTSLLAAQSFSFSEIWFPSYLMLLDAIVLFGILRKNNQANLFSYNARRLFNFCRLRSSTLIKRINKPSY